MRLKSGVSVCVALAAIVAVRALNAQEAVAPDWQTKAGGKMEFEVASVREDKGPFVPPSFALSPDDAYLANTDALNADFSLSTYIEFAYKLWLTSDQRHVLYDPLPKWVTTDRYTIRAKVDHPATKDQMRLMMQALLADRFGLKLHFESKDAAVVVMTLAKPGVLGPRLHAANGSVACDVSPRPSPAKGDPRTMSADEIPWTCNYTLIMRSGKMLLGGARSTTTELIAEFIGSLGGNFGLLTRPVVDQTCLTGRYDFTLEFAQPQRAGGDPGADAEQSAPAGPDLLEAAQEQLGLRFKPGKAIVSMPVIDHLERPSEN
jgi:uncharacterized protein (TIGR03435 family)